jgi:hypothetical protein
MEKIDALLKTPKLELLKALTDKIKSFSLKESVQATEKRLNGLSKTKKGLLGLSLILIGGRLTIYSVNNAANTSKAYWKELKTSNSSKLESNKSSTDFLKLKSINANGGTDNNVNGSANSNASNETSFSNVEWKPISYMLASTPARRAKALENIGFPQSEGVIIALSLHCPECIKLATDINSNLSKDELSSIVGVAVSPETEIKAWKEKLNLTYEVKAISEMNMEDLGVALFPTLIKVSNTSKNQSKSKSKSTRFEIVASSDDGRVIFGNGGFNSNSSDAKNLSDLNQISNSPSSQSSQASNNQKTAKTK